MTRRSSDHYFDIVIVGSGLTGLTTAYNVLKRDVALSVLILDKNDSTGGRILRGDNRSEGYYGTYAQKNVTKLLDQLKIQVMSARGPDAPGQNFTFLTRDSPCGVSRFVSCQVYHFLKMLNAMSTEAKEYALNNEQLGEMSIKRLMERTVKFRRARSICASLLRAVCPGIENLANVSALWFILGSIGAGGSFEKLSATLSADERFFLQSGGFERLVNELEKSTIDRGGILKLRENVVRIEREDRTISVTSESIDTNKVFRYECECVVVAVPPPDNARISIDASLLPRRFLESWKLYRGTSAVYFHATYRKPFLPASSVLIEDGPVRMIHEIPSGREARAIGGFSASRRLEEVDAYLKKYLGASKPMACGTCDLSPVYVPIPRTREIHDLTASRDRRIVFASSEFATEWPGTADGAIEAGLGAALAILSRMRPQALEANETTATSLPFDTRASSSSRKTAIHRTHAMFLGLNVSLFFILLREAWRTS